MNDAPNKLFSLEHVELAIESTKGEPILMFKRELLEQLADTMRENERMKKSMEAADAFLRDAFDFALPEYGGTIQSNLERAKWGFPKISKALWSWRDEPNKESENVG